MQASVWGKRDPCGLDTACDSESGSSRVVGVSQKTSVFSFDKCILSPALKILCFALAKDRMYGGQNRLSLSIYWLSNHMKQSQQWLLVTGQELTGQIGDFAPMSRLGIIMYLKPVAGSGGVRWGAVAHI